jgi:hypothetical protein
MSYTDSQGILHSDTGELIAAPSGAKKSSGGFWVSGENRYGVAPKEDTTSALPDLSGLSLGKEGTDIASLVSSSLPAVNKADIEAQTKAQLAPQRESLLGKYGAAIAQQEQKQAQETKALGGQMGTSRRFSSSAQAFIKFVSNENAKKIAELEVQRDDALSNFDFKLAQLVDQRIQNEQTAQQNTFNNIMKVMEVAQKQEEKTAAGKAKEIQASRENAIIDVASQVGEDASLIQQTINFDDNGKQVGDITLEEINTTLEKTKQDKTEIGKLVVDLGKSQAPPEIIRAVSSSKNLTEAVLAAGSYLEAGGTGIIGEYNFYARQEKNAGRTPLSFDDYQTRDANRKVSIAAAAVGAGAGLNSKQVAVFNSLVDKLNKSPLVAANDRAVTLEATTNALEADKQNSSLQVSFIYSLIQALDTYQSAVREGEISLVSGTQGVSDTIANLPAKISGGSVLSERKVQEYINVARLVKDAIKAGADIKTKAFKAQAKTAGIGDAFSEYIDEVQGIQSTANQASSDASNIETRIIKIGEKNPDLQETIINLQDEENMTIQEVYEWLQSNGYSE